MSHPEMDGTPPPKLELAPNFPGLDDDGQGPYVDHQAVRAAVSQLRRQLDVLRGNGSASMSATWSGPGTIGEVSGLSNVGSVQTGPWEVAANFGYNTQQAYKVFGGSYSLLLERAEEWAAAIEKAIDNYERGHIDSSA